VQLLGRERECAVIDRVLENASSGVSGALVVRGEAGIGKSALLEYAMQQAAPGMAVPRATGVEVESDLAFAGLHGLLRPVLAHLGELPQTQSEALAGALGLAPSSRPLLSLTRKVATSLTAASASARSTARRSPVIRVASAQAVTPGENGLSAFGPGDGGPADPGGLSQVPAGRPGQHASPAQLGGELVAPGTGRAGRSAGHSVSAFS
jgi:hypothetical protein